MMARCRCTSVLVYCECGSEGGLASRRAGAARAAPPAAPPTGGEGAARRRRPSPATPASVAEAITYGFFWAAGCSCRPAPTAGGRAAGPCAAPASWP